MTAEAMCGLCRTPGPTHARNFGLDLCETCHAGYLTGRLSSWGAEVVVEELEKGPTQRGATSARRAAFGLAMGQIPLDANDAEFILRVEGRLEGAQPLMATFRGRTLGRKVQGLFRRRFTSGDELFDAAVDVTTTTGPLVQQLVAHDGFASAVMNLVTYADTVKAEPGRISVVAALTGLDLRAEIPVAVASMLRYLADAS